MDFYKYFNDDKTWYVCTFRKNRIKVVAMGHFGFVSRYYGLYRNSHTYDFRYLCLLLEKNPSRVLDFSDCETVDNSRFRCFIKEVSDEK